MLRIHALCAVPLTLAALAAAAEEGTVIYGQINVGVVSEKNYIANYGGQVPKSEGMPAQFRVDGQASRLGFKGNEDLGGGLHAGFLLETGVSPDDGKSGSFGSREAWVNIGGNLGTLSLGRGKSLYTVAYEEIDQLYGNFSNAINGYGTSGSARDDGYGDDGYLYRVNNTVRYVFEKDAWKLGLEYAAGENKSAAQSARADYNGVVKYGTDDWWAQLAVDAARNANGEDGSRLRNWLAGGGVTVGEGQINLLFQRHSYNRAGYSNDRNSVQLAGYYSLPKFTLYGGVIRHGKLSENGAGVDKSEILHYGLGVGVPLSKRTVIRAEFGEISFRTDAIVDQRSAMLAVFHSF